MIVQLLMMSLLAYLVGSIPFGYLVVKLFTGEDIRQMHSGRTGGTNTMRSAGVGAGIIVALLDVTKGAITVIIARELFVFSNPWLLILMPLLAIVGHNYSIFMVSRDRMGKLAFTGGAGGAPCLGGAIGLWWPSGMIILVIGILIFYFIGYASVTTLWVALGSTLISGYRAILFGAPWAFLVYGIIAEGLLVIALRPNIKRLIDGTERLHGFRAKRVNNSQNYSS